MSSSPLFIFYEEPDPDRWFTGDRYPRRFVRRLLRGKQKPGGVMRWFLNLQTGLDLLGVEYRINDYSGLHRKAGAVAHVVGKSHVIDKIRPGHPIIFGPAISAHPYEDNFWLRTDISLIVISCEWFRRMYERDLPCTIPTAVWPAGIETELWIPSAIKSRGKILVYDKIRWRRHEYESSLLAPILDRLRQDGLDPVYLRYGHYEEEEYRRLLGEVCAMVFLCEHETQGFAYLQALSSDVPLFAWDRGGLWQDPSMYPARVQFGPVTSVPYFDERCGERFQDIDSFHTGFPSFLEKTNSGLYHPRDFILENFDLAAQARNYLKLTTSVIADTPA